MDETTDINSVSQLSVIIRYVSENLEVSTDFLGMIPLHGQLRGEDIVSALLNESNGIFKKFELDPFKIVSLSTDGAPAMLGKNIGAVKLFNDYIKKSLIINMQFYLSIV